MYNLIKKVLATHTLPDESKKKLLDVRLIALKLREMQMKINCTLQGNYFSKREQQLAIKMFTDEEERTKSEEWSQDYKTNEESKQSNKITKLLMQDFSNLLTLKPSY